MKNSNYETSSAIAAPVLQLVGIILIVASLIDYIVLSVPFNIQDKAWQLNWTTQTVDRGAIPLLGLALLLTGYWIRELTHPETYSPPRLKLPALILSSFFSLLFLLMAPFHISNIWGAQSQAVEQLKARVQQMEQQIAAQSQQVTTLLNNPQEMSRLDKAIQSGQFKGDQLTQLQQLQQRLQQFKNDPNALKKQVEEVQNRVRAEQKKAEDQASQEATKSVVRTGISSLLLAIGYGTISWLGFQSSGGAASGRDTRRAKTAVR